MTELANTHGRWSGSRFKGTIYYFGAFTLPGGNASSQRVRQNAKLFRDLGYRVVIVGVHEGTDRRIERRGSFAQDGFHTLSVAVGTGWVTRATSRLLAMSLLRIVQMHFESPAVICYNYASAPQAQLQIYCWLKGIPFAPDVTEWYGPSGSSVSDTLRMIDTTIRMRLLNKLASGIVTTSPYLTNFYANSDKPQIELPTLIDREETGTGVVNESGPLKLIFFGNPFNFRLKRPDPAHMKERIDTIVDILVEVNHERIYATLDVLGVDRDQYLSAFNIEGDDFDLPWLKFWGQVPRKQVFEATKQSDFSIFFREKTRPNLAGFPSKFAESITCGTPVITNPMPNLDAYAEHGLNCVLVNPKDKAACVETIRRLAGQRELIGTMKAHCTATTTFDYRRWAKPVDVFLQGWLSKEPTQ